MSRDWLPAAPPNGAIEWDALASTPWPSFGSGLDLWGITRRRKWFLVLGALVGLLLGVLHFRRQPAVYESNSRILVKQKADGALPIEGVHVEAYAGSAIRDYAAVITSPLVIERALREKGLASLASLNGSAAPVRTIRAGLTAEPLDEWYSSVLDLRFQGSDPEDCATILNALTETYEDFLGEMHQNVGKETTDLIARASDQLLTQLSEQESDYDEFRKQAPLIWKEGQGTNPHQERLTQIESARAQVLLMQTQLEAKILAIEAAIARGVSPKVVLMMAGHSDAGIETALRVPRSLSDPLFALQLEEQALADKYGPDYPKLMSIRHRIEYAKQLQREGTAEEEDGVEGTGSPEEILAVYLQSLREQVRAGQQERLVYDAAFEKEEEHAKALAEYQAEDARLRSNVQRTQRLFEAVVQRLEEISLVKDYGGYNVQVLSPAMPGAHVAPNGPRIILVFGVLGLLAGFGLAYGVDKSDKTFRGPAEIGQQLSLPLMGHIPMMPEHHAVGVDSASKLAPILCTQHHPQSPRAESFRAIRTALYFNTRGQKHRVIQITSPSPQDGKSTLSANLAVTIAHSGKRVLLLDADFRRPTQHKLFGVDNRVGLASVVDGKADPQEAVQSTDVANLFLMSCGPRPPNPSELLTSPRLEELLALVREEFDFVLVDTPPLLVVTDPSAVAPRVDGVLLTLRIKKNVRPDAMRARNLLADLGANVLGIVVNGVGEAKDYGYGDYRSVYGGYRGEYGYADDGNESDVAAGEAMANEHTSGRNGRTRFARRAGNQG